MLPSERECPEKKQLSLRRKLSEVARRYELLSNTSSLRWLIRAYPRTQLEDQFILVKIDPYTDYKHARSEMRRRDVFDCVTGLMLAATLLIVVGLTIGSSKSMDMKAGIICVSLTAYIFYVISIVRTQPLIEAWLRIHWKTSGFMDDVNRLLFNHYLMFADLHASGRESGDPNMVPRDLVDTCVHDFNAWTYEIEMRRRAGSLTNIETHETSVKEAFDLAKKLKVLPPDAGLGEFYSRARKQIAKAPKHPEEVPAAT